MLFAPLLFFFCIFLPCSSLFSFFISAFMLCTILLLIFFFNMGFLSFSHHTRHRHIVFAPQLHSPPSLPSAESLPVPRLAYAISGSKGELDRLWRTLLAVYHPRNLYVLHLDLDSPVTERLELASRVRMNSVFAEIDNVDVVANANMVTYRGPCYFWLHHHS